MPLSMSLIVTAIQSIQQSKTKAHGDANLDKKQQSAEQTFVTKWLSKVENMPKPFRHFPFMQSLYNLSVAFKLSQLTDEIDKKKKLLEEFPSKRAECGVIGNSYFQNQGLKMNQLSQYKEYIPMRPDKKEHILSLIHI